MVMKLLRASIFSLALAPSLVFAQAQLPAGNFWGNPTAAKAPGQPGSITQMLDRALNNTRGNIIERGAAGWVPVAPSATAGLPWASNGTGADPSYQILPLAGGGCAAALTASNGGILYSTVSACAILAGTATARLPLLSGATAAPVWGAYSLPASVTSGGIACFTSTSAEGSSVLLTANALVLGGGAGVCPSPMASLGTTTTVLHGNAGGAPTYAAVVSADMNITATNCTNQFVSAISTGGVGTCASVPIGSAVSGLGTGVAAALAANVNSSGGICNPTPTRAGDIFYWNGTSCVTLPGNNSGTNILQETSAGVPSWVANAGFTAVTKADQQAATSNVLAVTPLHQQDHDSALKSHGCATISGTTLTNCTNNFNGSWARSGVGVYVWTFSPTIFSSANYDCTFGAAVTPVYDEGAGRSSSAITMQTFNSSIVSADAATINIQCAGRQ